MAVNDPYSSATPGVHGGSGALDPLQRFQCFAHLKHDLALLHRSLSRLARGRAKIFRRDARIFRRSTQCLRTLPPLLGTLAARLRVAPVSLRGVAG